MRKLKLAALAVLTLASLTSCVTTMPLAECESKITKLMEAEIFPARQCFGVVDQKLVASAQNMPPSMMLVILCRRTVELIGMIDAEDTALLKSAKENPNTKSYGECSHKGRAYSVVSTSVKLEEPHAEVK